jgi:hypothetical protein
MRPLIVLGIFLFVTSAVFAQPNPKRSAGFKLFRLGMTHSDVNRVIKETPWQFQNGVDTLDPDAPRFDKNLSVNVRGVHWGDTSSSQDSTLLDLITVACHTDEHGETSCAYAYRIDLYFFDSRLYNIQVRGPWYREAGAPVARYWAALADSALSSVYGERYDSKFGVFSLDTSMVKYGIAKGITYVSTWDLPKSRFGTRQTAAVALERDGSPELFSSFVTISDDGLIDKAEKAAERRAKEEEEERNKKRKFKSGF